MTALNQGIVLLYQSHNSLQLSSFRSDIPRVVKEQGTYIWSVRLTESTPVIYRISDNKVVMPSCLLKKKKSGGRGV